MLCAAEFSKGNGKAPLPGWQGQQEGRLWGDSAAGNRKGTDGTSETIGCTAA